MTIQKAVRNFKTLIESSIKKGGGKAKTAMIRSSRPILTIHEAVKHKLVKYGIDESKIFPPLGQRTPELKIAGAFKKKDQDICVIPNAEKKKETLREGLLEGVEDEFGINFTGRTIAINVRSQISSIQKNFDTLYERTILEAQNLHDRCPKMVLGEIYMIAVPEYNDKEYDKKAIKFKAVRPDLVEKYIKSFQAVNKRQTVEKNFYQYESVCLLIVDFRKTQPKIYSSSTELKRNGFLPETSTVSMDGLDLDSFVPNLLKIYKARFG